MQIFKLPVSCPPARSFSELVSIQESVSGSAPSTLSSNFSLRTETPSRIELGSVKLLARPKSPLVASAAVFQETSDSKHSPLTENSSEKNDDTGDSAAPRLEQLTLAEREEQYEKARARIFATAEELDPAVPSRFPSGENQTPTNMSDYHDTFDNFASLTEEEDPNEYRRDLFVPQRVFSQPPLRMSGVPPLQQSSFPSHSLSAEPTASYSLRPLSSHSHLPPHSSHSSSIWSNDTRSYSASQLSPNVPIDFASSDPKTQSHTTFMNVSHSLPQRHFQPCSYNQHESQISHPHQNQQQQYIQHFFMMQQLQQQAYISNQQSVRPEFVYPVPLSRSYNPKFGTSIGINRTNHSSDSPNYHPRDSYSFNHDAIASAPNQSKF